MLNVVCVNAGDYQGLGVEYVNTLFDSVRRNLPEGFPGRFIVFTDQSEGYDLGIEVRPLPGNLTGWWNKLYLFKPGLFGEDDRIVYLDLSCVITGRLDRLMDYDGHFSILRDFYFPEGLQSSVMAWPAGFGAEIWESYELAGFPSDDLGGDQVWIEKTQMDAVRLQDVLPDFFASHKLLSGIPEKAAVVVFHGHPKPHESGGWVDMVWKKGGLMQADLIEICNTEREKVLDNVRSAIKRCLPWFDFGYDTKSEPVCIVGSGPSLPRNLGRLRGEIWSMNGSHDFLLSHGIQPTAHFMLDARPENVAFVRNPQKATKYYVASQCAPEVFDALNGFDVTVFHCKTDGVLELVKDTKDKTVSLLGGGSTVGMKAMDIASLFGYREIQLYGMDSCYEGNSHHAFPQSMNDGERIVDVFYVDRSFKCAPWMSGQANDFIDFLMRYTGVVKVAGDGLLAHIAKTGVPESAADTRAREILSRVGDKAKGAEIGVFAADLSERLLNKGLELILVDSWESGTYRNTRDFHSRLSKEEQEGFYEMTKERVKFANGRARIIRKRSVDAAKFIEDGSLDFVFIDADHSYEGCRDDIEAWAPKVKKGGWISGHDYDNPVTDDGVKQAVSEFAKGKSVELGDNFTWFIRR